MESEPSERPASRGDTHPCHIQGIALDEGARVLFNDRKRPLEVVGSHERQNASRTRRMRGEAKYYTVVELEGNGTEYHLLCLKGSEYGPLLYKESDWDEDRTNKIGGSPRYSRMGERVETMEVVE